jgi:hypothetical protein
MMSKKTLTAVGLVSIGLLLYAIASTGAVGAQDLMRALVVNLETPHPVTGTMSVSGTIQHARVVRVNDVIVSTARRQEPPQWVEAGTVDTDGFTSVVVSLQGQLKGSIARNGSVGAILIPDEEPILQALTEGVVQLPLEVTAEVSPSSEFFSGSRPSLTVAFPRYRVFFYNTAGQTVSANLYLYLTN